MSSADLMYVFGQEVPKLVYAFLQTCKSVSYDLIFSDEDHVSYPTMISSHQKYVEYLVMID